MREREFAQGGGCGPQTQLHPADAKKGEDESPHDGCPVECKAGGGVKLEKLVHRVHCGGTRMRRRRGVGSDGGLTAVLVLGENYGQNASSDDDARPDQHIARNPLPVQQGGKNYVCHQRQRRHRRDDGLRCT